MQVESPPQAPGRPEFRTLPEVAQDQASGELRTLYNDILQSLGVSLVNAVYRVLGVHPEFLQKAWKALRPNLLSPAFDSGANQLRAVALQAVAPFPAPGADLPLLARLGYLPRDIDQIRRGICTFHYVNPHLLLWVAALRAARERRLGESAAPAGLAAPAAGNPAVLHLVPPEEAPPEVAARYRGLMQLLGAPVVNSDFQFLGGFPTYFYYVYPYLQELIQAPGFFEAAAALGAQADRLALSLPYQVDFTREATGEAEAKLDLFYGLLPRLILLVAQVTRRLGCPQEWYNR